MAKNGFKVCDSDMHVVEPADLWDRYIDPAFRDRAPKGLSRHPRDLAIQLNGNIYPPENRSYTNAITPIMTEQMDVYTESESRGWDNSSQVTAMDNEGIDIGVMFPSRGLFSLGSGDIQPDLATAISRGYNDWLSEFCSGSDRTFGAGMIPPHDVNGAVKEARRANEEQGFKNVNIRPLHKSGQTCHCH